MKVTRGWHYESYRHSLAARGISTRARALVKPSGEMVYKDIGIYRVERTISDLGGTLKRGYIGHDVTDYGIYGGLTTSLETGPSIDTIGNIYVEFDRDVILDKNDLIEIEYTPEFFLENPDIAQQVDFRVSYPVKSKHMLEHLATTFRDECELVSRKPIVFPQTAVKRIEVHYGYGVKDPITGKYDKDVTDEEESWKLGRKIIEEVQENIPDWYWNRIWLINTTTGEEQMLRWLI